MQPLSLNLVLFSRDTCRISALKRENFKVLFPFPVLCCLHVDFSYQHVCFKQKTHDHEVFLSPDFKLKEEQARVEDE